MKNILNLFLLLILAGSVSSCLKADLEDLPAFSDADITSFKFEFRWISNGVVKIKVLTNDPVISKESATVVNNVTIPPADAEFTSTVRTQVSLSNLIGYCNISTAARMEPIEGAPVLGVPGDFSGARRYKITAADGTVKIWTITTVIKP